MFAKIPLFVIGFYPTRLLLFFTSKLIIDNYHVVNFASFALYCQANVEIKYLLDSNIFIYGYDIIILFDIKQRYYLFSGRQYKLVNVEICLINFTQCSVLCNERQKLKIPLSNVISCYVCI